MEEKQTDLETENKITLTQSQARDTRNRRMQEVNSLCMDS